MAGLTIGYRPAGPVAAAFMASRAPVKGIMGPVGSGKTSACLLNLVELAAEQAPSPLDGVRYSKFAVIRDTYRNLEKTTIPSWHAWIPPSVGQWVGSQPAFHRIRFKHPAGLIDLWVEFIALGDNRVEDVMRGWEGTGAYLNEADRLDPEVLTYVRSRIGRYPGKTHGGATWSGVLIDFNAPDTENYLYKLFVEDPAAGIEFYRQPGAFEGGAENLPNLPSDYYERQVSGQPDWFVRRMIHNRWGYSREGKPVYPEFNDALHVARAEPRPDDAPLLLGLDAGLTPAGVLLQRRANGQWRALDELVVGAGESMGPKRFGAALARVLRERYAGLPVSGWADPAAAYGADREGGERDWIQIVAAEAGVRIRPAPTNKLIPRLEAVRLPLTRLIDGADPGFLLSPRCKMLRRGFNAGYRYRRVQLPGEAQYRDEPEKNSFSHVQDALQYGLSGGGEHHEVMGRKKAQASAAAGQIAAITEDAPTGVYVGGGGRRRGHQSFAETEG